MFCFCPGGVVGLFGMHQWVASATWAPHGLMETVVFIGSPWWHVEWTPLQGLRISLAALGSQL